VKSGGAESRCVVSTPNYSWQSLYREALVETDLARQRERIRAAEDAIRVRRRELINRGEICEEVYEAENALLRLTWLREIPSAKAKCA